MDNTAYRKIETVGTQVPLKVLKGHFATNHSHTNYYLDLTTIKTRASEAKDVASALVNMYLYGTVVDTVICDEGTQVIGAYLAEELTKGGFLNTNAHKTIYVVTPEFNSNSQIIFRDNIKPMIQGKHVLILEGTITTGKTANRAVEAIQYYGGVLAGISAVFSAIDVLNDVPVVSVFGKKDIPDYGTFDYHECPLCKEKKSVDGLINAFGISLI